MNREIIIFALAMGLGLLLFKKVKPEIPIAQISIAPPSNVSEGLL